MSTRLLLTALCTLSLAARSWAQAETPPATAEPAATIEGAAPVASTVSRDKDTLSVDFPDEEIKTILRNVADLFELNLVVPDTLTGKTSIKLRDVTWRQIFAVVLSPVGYSYIEEGNIIKVVSNDSLLAEPTTTDVIIINNAKAADLVPTITVLIDSAAGGKIVVDGRSNALVITERPSRMGRIRQTIEALDKATEQVMIETKFVEVTDRDIRNIGVNWASLQGMTLGVRGINQTFTRNRGQSFGDGFGTDGASSSSTSNNTNTSSSNGTSAGTNSSSNTTGQSGTSGTVTSTSTTGSTLTPVTTTTTDPITGLVTQQTVPTQVPNNSSNTTTTTTTPTGSTISTTSGSNGSTTTTNSTSGSSLLSNAASSALNSFSSLTNTGGTSRVASAVFSSSDFNVILSALKTLNNTKIVSNPTVVTLNNTEAFINIGQEFPIPNYTYNAERGAFEVSGFNYKPIGIIMKVTPQVNAQGLIKLTVEPEVSQTNGSTSFGGAGGASIPIIATRKAKTQVSLQNGFTMGIGGLITSSKDHGSTRVPVLGDIPGLGRLFKSKAVNDTATNLIIFLTARTVSAEGASPEDVFDPSAINAVGGLNAENLPGQRAPRQ